MSRLLGHPITSSLGTDYAYSDEHYPTIYAIVATVAREGPDVVMTLTNLRPWSVDSWKYKLFYNATVRFSNATRITSVYTWNPAIECRLEPGWQVGGVMLFDGIVVRLPVQYVDVHDIITVLHSIYCDTVTITKRLNVRRTVWLNIFKRSRPKITYEPKPSAPIEGQDPVRAAAPPREDTY